MSYHCEETWTKIYILGFAEAGEEWDPNPEGFFLYDAWLLIVFTSDCGLWALWEADWCGL